MDGERFSTLRIAVVPIAVALLYVFPYFPQINNPNENVRFYLTAAIVEEGTYCIDTMRARWGWVNDTAVRDGRVYSTKAPGTSLLGVPAYALYAWASKGQINVEVALWLVRVTGTIIPVLFFLYFFYRWLSRQSSHEVVRNSVFFSIALGSLLFAYAYLFVSHTLSAACAFGSFMWIHDARKRQSITAREAFVIGMLTGGVTCFEYPGIVASMILAIYSAIAMRPRHRLLWFVLGGLIPTLLVMHFQWKSFGNPLTPGHHLAEVPAFREVHRSGFFGIDNFYPEAAYRLMFDFAIGLIPMTPILVLAVPGFVKLLRSKITRVDASFALALVLSMYLVICTLNNWSGGWVVGPRYLALMVPFIAWAAVIGGDEIASRMPARTSAFCIGCTAASFAAGGIPSMYYPHLPPEITHPLPQLFLFLIRNNYAPKNAGNLIGLEGSVSMIPMLLLAVFILVKLVKQLGQGLTRIRIAGGACGIAVLALAPQFLTAKITEPSETAVTFITEHWNPPK